MSEPSATVAHARSSFGHLTSGDYDTSLLTTVSVGCALLAVNVLILLCVCYHRKVRGRSVGIFRSIISAAR